MRVLILGCGYIGIQLGAELVQRGHSVWGGRRSERADAALKSAGIVPVRLDITAPETFPTTKPAFDWVVDCVSAAGGGAAEYEKVYLEGAQHLVSWLSSAPPTKLVYTSSTSVYGQNDGSWVDENSPVTPDSSTAQILLRAEDHLINAVSSRRIPTVVLRVAGIYGPGRAFWIEQFRSGAARTQAGGERVLNMIHQHDVTGAVIAALERGNAGRIYNVVDDEPVTQLAFFEWLSARLNCPVPAPGPAESLPARKRGLTNKKISNRRLKAELDFRCKFPTFREGYEHVLNS